VLLAGLAGLLDTAGNALYMLSSLGGRLDVAAVLSSLYPGATIVLAAVVLRERATRLQAVGMVCALAAVALIAA
jgi:drug/metabolite transporter (DMT)-like permease